MSTFKICVECHSNHSSLEEICPRCQGLSELDILKMNILHRLSLLYYDNSDFVPLTKKDIYKITKKKLNPALKKEIQQYWKGESDCFPYLPSTNSPFPLLKQFFTDVFCTYLGKIKDNNRKRQLEERYRARSNWSGVPYKVLYWQGCWKVYEVCKSLEEAREIAQEISGRYKTKLRVAYIEKIRIDHDPDEPGIDIFVYRRLKPGKGKDLYYAKVRIPVISPIFTGSGNFWAFQTVKIKNIRGKACIRLRNIFCEHPIVSPRLEFYDRINQKIRRIFRRRNNG